MDQDQNSETIIAIGQLCSTADIEQNLLTCQKLAKEASEQGAKVCFFLFFAPNTQILKSQISNLKSQISNLKSQISNLNSSHTNLRHSSSLKLQTT
ncbi:hypothetical protein BPAE_0040g00480 [Botrytis paeoniae]|uniref:CN hydrolase domain-containing protein n=1 Tax=Botrytis paeoniae TaxID=278948 RepID=A0A4Z1G0E7_9HELO|nr:hypothetical protein BPAE_0040g00480 [Botrytis paeoniae]